MKDIETKCTDAVVRSTAEMVSKILTGIAIHKESVKISVEPLARSVVICVQVHPADMPRAIGRGGAHIKALGKIVDQIGMTNGVPIKIRLLEPQPGERDRYLPFQPKEEWDGKSVHELLRQVASAAIPGGAAVERNDGVAAVTEFVVRPVRRQPAQEFGELIAALNSLWNAIGRATGRIVTVSEGEPVSSPA